MGDRSNSMWDIYDLWRTAKLNIKYFTALSNKFQRCSIFFDVIIAITTPSGAVAALWFWDNSIGSYVWKILFCLASVCVVIKPIMNCNKKVQKAEKIVTAYKLLYHDIDLIIIKIKNNKGIVEQLMSEFYEALARKRLLIKNSSEFSDNKRLIRKYTNEVNEELSSYEFYIPKEIENV